MISHSLRKIAQKIVILLSVSVLAAQLSAQPSSLPQERPPISESFGVGELTLSATALIGLGALSLWGHNVIGPKGASMGAPAEGSNDLRVSRWANPTPQASAQWLGGAPDLMGYAAPSLALTYYVGGSLLNGGRGGLGAHAHEAIAFSEGLSWAMFSTTLLKHLVGRERPYVVRGRLGELNAAEVEMNATERLLSFPSGHSTAIAATSFFVAADLSDALVSGPLRSSSALTRLGLGRVAPYLGAGALSWLVMYSRIKDQRHWLSDTLVGGLIGATSALLSYHMHFDALGRPRSRHTSSVQ